MLKTVDTTAAYHLQSAESSALTFRLNFASLFLLSSVLNCYASDEIKCYTHIHHCFGWYLQTHEHRCIQNY
jgi:hypothetical protein